MHNIFTLLLGGYDKEEKAAKAYDLAALKYWGPTTHINFPVRFLRLEQFTFVKKVFTNIHYKEKKFIEKVKYLFCIFNVCSLKHYIVSNCDHSISTTFLNAQLSTYDKELEEMKHMTRQEFVANLRRYH